MTKDRSQTLGINTPHVLLIKKWTEIDRFLLILNKTLEGTSNDVILSYENINLDHVQLVACNNLSNFLSTICNLNNLLIHSEGLVSTNGLSKNVNNRKILLDVVYIPL